MDYSAKVRLKWENQGVRESGTQRLCDLEKMKNVKCRMLNGQ